jgi:hypothetical protein
MGLAVIGAVTGAALSRPRTMTIGTVTALVLAVFLGAAVGLYLASRVVWARERSVATT